MALTTNVTILVPGRKFYCDYTVNLVELPAGSASGRWSVIDYMPTPVRQGYTKFNSFKENVGDAFLDKGAAPGYHLFFFPFGFLTVPLIATFGRAYVHMVMDDREHMFAPKGEHWAKKAELIPSMEEAIAIFWK